MLGKVETLHFKSAVKNYIKTVAISNLVIFIFFNFDAIVLRDDITLWFGVLDFDFVDDGVDETLELCVGKAWNLRLVNII